MKEPHFAVPEPGKIVFRDADGKETEFSPFEAMVILEHLALCIRLAMITPKPRGMK